MKKDIWIYLHKLFSTLLCCEHLISFLHVQNYLGSITIQGDSILYRGFNYYTGGFNSIQRGSRTTLCRIQGGAILYRGVQELPCAEYRVVQLLYRGIQYYTEGFKNYLVQNTGWINIIQGVWELNCAEYREFNYYTGGFNNIQGVQLLYRGIQYYTEGFKNYLVQNTGWFNIIQGGSRTTLHRIQGGSITIQEGSKTTLCRTTLCRTTLYRTVMKHNTVINF